MLSDFPSLDPDPSTFNAMMTLYLRLGRADDAGSIFDLMVHLNRSGRIDTRPDTYSVNLMLESMTKHSPQLTWEDLAAVEEVLANCRQRYRVLPDVTSYNIVIDAWAKSRLRDAADRAEMLLKSMERECRHNSNNDDRAAVAPDGYSFTSTINAIEQCRRRSDRGSWAVNVFRRMEDLHSRGLVEAPTTPVYNALLNCLISSGEDGSLERAEALFSNVDDAGLANARTFNTMLKGYSTIRRSGSNGAISSYSRPRKAEALLDIMELSYVREGRASAIVPDKYSYTTVISAYGRSNARRKAAKALMVLERMIESHDEGNSAARPGTYAFNAVLNACAHTRNPEERVEAFSILCSTLILLRDWARPDHTTYGTFLQACARLLPRDESRKWRVVETVFDICVKEGQCSELVLKNLKGVASPELYEVLVGRFLTKQGLEIPLQWRRNVDRG